LKKILNLLGLAKKAGKLAIGDEAVNDALRNGQAVLLISASDASIHIKRYLESQAADGIAYVPLASTKAELGPALGRALCAAAAVLDEGFASAILKLAAAQQPQAPQSRKLLETAGELDDYVSQVRQAKKARQNERKQHSRPTAEHKKRNTKNGGARN